MGTAHLRHLPSAALAQISNLNRQAVLLHDEGEHPCEFLADEHLHAQACYQRIWQLARKLTTGRSFGKCIVNRHDSSLLRPTLECLSRFGFFLPESIRVDLDSGYDSQATRELLTEFGCQAKISPKGTYIEINHTRRCKVERVNSWHTRGFGLLQIVLDRVDRVQRAWACLANAIIVLRRLLKESWVALRWATRPVKGYDQR